MLKKLSISVFLVVLNIPVSAQDLGVRDTLTVERLEIIPPSAQAVLNVYGINDLPLAGFEIPLTFPDTLSDWDITCDSVSFIGTRTETATYSGSIIENDKNRFMFWAFFAPGFGLDPGNGPVAQIHFTTGPFWNLAWYVWVDTVSWYSPFGMPISLEFGDTLGNRFIPAFEKGLLEVKETTIQTTPEFFSPFQNYPNPFNPVCNIEYSLPEASHVTLSIYNILGQRLRVLVDEYESSGHKSLKWNGKDELGREVTSGIYFYRLEAGGIVLTKKMVCLK